MVAWRWQQCRWSQQSAQAKITILIYFLKVTFYVMFFLCVVAVIAAVSISVTCSLHCGECSTYSVHTSNKISFFGLNSNESHARDTSNTTRYVVCVMCNANLFCPYRYFKGSGSSLPGKFIIILFMYQATHHKCDTRVPMVRRIRVTGCISLAYQAWLVLYYFHSYLLAAKKEKWNETKCVGTSEKCGDQTKGLSP